MILALMYVIGQISKLAWALQQDKRILRGVECLHHRLHMAGCMFSHDFASSFDHVIYNHIMGTSQEDQLSMK